MAMVELNYQPDAVARSLRRRETLTLGLLVPSVEIPFYASVAYGVERIASDHGYSIILCNSDWKSETAIRHMQDFLARRVDGVICNSAGLDAEGVAMITDSGSPVVLLEESIPGIELDVIGVDNTRGAYMAARHLLKDGHCRLGIITGHLAYNVSQDRLKGARQAMNEAGQPTPSDLVFEGDYLPATGREAVARFFSIADSPTAILAFNDLMAMGALQALTERSLKVPDDVAVMGFDDIPLSEYTGPGLSTVRQPLLRMCRAAVEVLLQRITGDGPAETQQVLLTPELIIRASTNRQKSKILELTQ
jgi:LacI family transcriptional regulator